MYTYYSSANQPYKFSSLTAFPTSAKDGTLAEDLSTHTLYVYNSTSSTWQPVNKTTNYPVNYASIAAGVLPVLGAAYAPDGVNVTNGQTVLFTGLTLAADRGVFRATVAAGLVTAWTRVIYGQSPTGASTDGDVVIVIAGTTYGEHWFQCTDTTTATWLDLGVGSNYLVRTGTVLSPAVSTDSVEAQSLAVRKYANTYTVASINNTTTGTAASESLYLTEDAALGAKALVLNHLNTGYTTSGIFKANGSYIRGSDTGGLYVVAQDATGILNFVTGGTADANVRMTIDAAGAVTVSNNQNGATLQYITNTTSGTAAIEQLKLSEDNANKAVTVTHFNSGYTTSGIFQATRSMLNGADTGGLLVGSSNAAGDLNFFTGGSADANVRMTIDHHGLVTINNSQNADTRLNITNGTAGTAASESLCVGVAGLPTYGVVLSWLNGSYTTAGIYKAGTGYLYTNNANGLYIGASNAAGTLNFYTGGSLDANNRMTISAAGTITAPGIVASTMSTVTVVAAATTFAVASNVVKVTGDAGGNTVATITGGVSGQVLTLIFVDDKVTITDTAAATADTVNLSAAFTSAANTVLTLVYDNNKWFEVSRSVNG